MKKVLLTLAFLAGFRGAAQAQRPRFGVKAGTGLASMTGDAAPGFHRQYLGGFLAGVMADIGFGDRLSFHPEALYAQKGQRVTNGALYSQSRLAYLDLPLLLRAHAGGVFFEAGPQVGVLLGSKYEDNLFGSTHTYAGPGDTRKVDVGYIAGVGYRLASGLEGGVRYNGGFVTVRDANPSGSNTARNAVFQLQLGYLFGGH